MRSKRVVVLDGEEEAAEEVNRKAWVYDEAAEEAVDDEVAPSPTEDEVFAHNSAAPTLPQNVLPLSPCCV